MQSANTQRFWMGAAISFLVALIIFMVFWLIWQQKGQTTGYPVDIPHLLRMSVLQAGLTTILSIGIGILLAWSLNRLRFPGRSLLVSLLSAALVTPGIVVAVGLISVWGRSGWLNNLLAQFGLQTGSIFGLQGILYAHVILDATFAAAIFLTQLDALSQNKLKIGQNLRLTSWQRFKTLDWPVITPAIPGLSAIIFLLAFTSFPIVLTLGGGPANQTFEVAIYTAIRLDFDLQTAVILALVQLALSALLVIPASIFALTPPAAGSKNKVIWRDAKFIQYLQITILLVSAIVLGTPLLSIILDGIGITSLMAQNTFWRAFASSLGIGLTSAILAVVLGLIVSMARISSSNKISRTLIGAPSYVYLAVPGVTLSLGFFLGTRFVGISPGLAAPLVLIFANALLALPYAVATLGPGLEASSKRYGALCINLGLRNWTRFTKIEWPTMGREIGLVFAMSFCFSLGDLSVISLFGTQDFATLPWLMSRALGAYRTNDAAAIAAVLLIVCTLSFLLAPKLFERLARART